MPESTSPGAPGKTDHLKPGDHAAAGTEGTGEDLCEDCGGKGVRQDGSLCTTCEGSGHLIHGIGGG
jgi:hypothetical protein